MSDFSFRREQVQSTRSDRHPTRHQLFYRLFFPMMLGVLLWSSLFANMTVTAHVAQAAAFPTPSAAKQTVGKFLAQKASSAQQNFTYPAKQQAVPWTSELSKNKQKALPGSEPASMKTIRQALAPAFLANASGTQANNAGTAGQQNGAPLHLQGSDGRLTVTIPGGAFDISQARIGTATATADLQKHGFTVNLVQMSGNSVGNVNSLGFYQFQFTDMQGHALTGIHLRHPITIQYHYQPQEIQGMGMDPGKLLLTWPAEINQALAAKKSTAGLTVPMQNNVATHTLTAQVAVIGTVASVATGSATDQGPAKPLQASVMGNTGQFSYTYPITVAPGPSGTVPTVQVSYSSQGTNERHEPTSPADGPGEGWGISMGSVSAENYPSGSAISGVWYTISGVDNVSDRLIPTSSGSTTYYTEHLSQLKIQQVTPSGASQPCFHVWDTAGTYYEYGCTTDSLQYSTDTTGARTNYRWDLDRIVPPNEGPGTSTRFTTVTYLQDLVTVSSHTTVRDAVIKQITYGVGTSGTALAGTVDFLYKGVTAVSSNGIQWVMAYGSNEGGCAPPSGQPATTLRCDDPVNFTGGVAAPTVMSTYSLQTIKSYVGADTLSSLEPAYSYSFSNSEGSYHQCVDARTGASAWCAGEHILNSITPTVYQNNVAHQLLPVTFTYIGGHNYYIDSSQTVSYGNYGSNDYWYYLASYHDHSTGAGETVTYQTVYNNTHGTPNSGSDNRFDPTYCYTHTTCTGSFANPDDKAWTMQVVNTVTTVGKDSSASNLQPGTTTYTYGMPTWTGTCPADSTGLTTCTGYIWYPSGEGDWQDYYHGEFHGFSWVYITSPQGNLTVQNYASTEGWGTAEGFSGNYTAGQLYEEDVYSGPTSDPNKLISKMRNTYAGNNFTLTSCRSGSYNAYMPCEIVLTSTRTTDYEQTGASNVNAPWVQHDYTYDDYSPTAGFGSYPQSPATGAYHNLQQDVITSSNAPTITKKWTYNTTDTTVGGQVYYNVHAIAHSEIDDASGHAWQCQDTLYDEGTASGVPRPAAGWPTTTINYTNCGNHSAGATLTGYTGFDKNGQGVVTVDALATANPGLYASAGCTLTTAPAFMTSNWTVGRYTACTTYDTQGAMPVLHLNAFGQTAATNYTANQAQIMTSVQDVNAQTTQTSYSYDSGGNTTEQVQQPGETGSYSSQSKQVAACTDSSTLPCLETDTNNSLYSGAVTRTFYDSQDRAVETLSPAVDSAHTIVSFTIYNDATNSVFTSQPFTVASQSAWLDPNNYASTPGSTKTMDAAKRTISSMDAIGKTSTIAYGLGSVSGDSNTYATTTTTDANGHITVAYADALGRGVYVQNYSGKSGGTLTPVDQETFQYNVLGLQTSVIVQDLAPQAGQTVTSVTTTAQYDDQGRMTTLNDPDRGTHTYTYDPDGHLIGDVSGGRVLGYSYDLLGRIGCVQDTAVVLDAHGACSNGANPFVQNTYDSDPSGVTWSGTNYAIGKLTQSKATTYLPGPDYSQGYVVENMHYDQRGRVDTERLTISANGGSLNFPTLPQYQEALNYNDANQLTTTQTTIGGQSGYTFTQVYDGNTGAQTGLSNNSVGVANLATLSYNGQGLVSGINYFSSTGAALASSTLSYDGDQRATGTNATWQNGNTIYAENLAYDAVGNVVSRSTTMGAVPGVNNSGGTETQNFCYDEQNRLVWAGNAGTVPAANNGSCGSAAFQSTLGNSYQKSYVYTHLGQLWQGPLNGTGAQEQYLYCNSGQPHQVTALAPVAGNPTCSAQGATDYSTQYDSWGNVTSRMYSGVTGTMAYDGLDHLVRWNGSNNGQTEWYLYDGSGERVLRRSFDGTNTSITVYAFGLEEHQYSYSGSGSSATNTGNTYYYGLSGHLVGTLSGTTVQSTTFMLSDTLGSVVASFSNANGTASLLGEQVYGPYGNQRYAVGTMGTDKGFTGQYHDGLTGLDYYNARYYDPVVGRFLQADDVQGNAQGSDPYDYVGGNPESRTDPTGERFISEDGSSWAIITPRSSNSDTLTIYTPEQGITKTIVTYPYYVPSPWYGGHVTHRQATRKAAPVVHRPRPHPKPASSQGSVGDGIKNAAITTLDLLTGIPSMINDVHTLSDGNASWWDKLKASADLAFNGISDLSMLIGVGEALRGGMILGHLGADVLEHVGGDVSAHVEECVGLSFRASTTVATVVGARAIGTIQVGDQVWAYNPQTKRMEAEPVLHVWLNHDNDLVDLTITTQKEGKKQQSTQEVIHTNQKHPFLTVEKGFVAVGQITLGMHVIEGNGSVGVVSGWKVVPGVEAMYNLEVAQDHTFVVGVGMWVVHNCGNNEWIKSLPQDPQTLIDEGWQDVTHPQAKANTSSMNLQDPATGRSVRFDKGVPEDPGFGGKDHYHVYNPNSTGKGDLYLDVNGNPVPRNSKPSHILPGR